MILSFIDFHVRVLKEHNELFTEIWHYQQEMQNTMYTCSWCHWYSYHLFSLSEYTCSNKWNLHRKYTLFFLLSSTCNIIHPIYTYIPANVFWVKCMRFSSSQDRNFWKYSGDFWWFLEDFWTLPNMSEDVLKLFQWNVKRSEHKTPVHFQCLKCKLIHYTGTVRTQTCH